jgi:hypothetical protein
MSIFPATKKQIKYIELLKSEVESMGERLPDNIEELLNRDNLLNAEASMIIDDLKELLGWEE